MYTGRCCSSKPRRAGPTRCQLARPSAADIATVGRLRRSSAIGRRAEALQQLRAGHQHARGLAEVLDHQAAAVVEVGAHAQRHVHALLHEVDHAIGHLHVDAHLRMRAPGSAAAAGRWWSAPASPGR